MILMEFLQQPFSRSMLWIASILGLTALLVFARRRKQRNDIVVLDVVVFNYLSRPIFDIFIDGRLGESSSAYPATGGSVITLVTFTLGPKHVTWRLDGRAGTPRNGETIVARNSVYLDAVPPGAKMLGVHIYPDDTVELRATVDYPNATRKGIEVSEAAARRRRATALAGSPEAEPDPGWDAEATPGEHKESMDVLPALEIAPRPVCIECLVKRARQRTAFVNREA